MIVYFHRNPVTYEIFYVGIGTSLYRAKSFGPTARNCFWYRYVLKYGLPVVQIVHNGISKEKAIKWEIHYILLLGKRNNGGQLVNISDGGETGDNLALWTRKNPEKNPSFRPEHTQRMKLNNPMHNPIYVDKVRKANIGKTATDETKKKQRDAKIGKPSTRINYKHSPEVIERLKIINKEIAQRPEVKEAARLRGEKMKGKVNIAVIKKVDMLNKDTSNYVKTFDSITDALRYLNKATKDGNISQVCKGKRNYAFGYKWVYSAA